MQRRPGGASATVILRAGAVLRATVTVLASVLVLGGLNACAEGGASYPAIGSISDLTGILTPQERDKTLSDLSTEQRRHGDDAAKTIDKR